jgi:hypothetical protein
MHEFLCNFAYDKYSPYSTLTCDDAKEMEERLNFWYFISISVLIALIK